MQAGRDPACRCPRLQPPPRLCAVPHGSTEVGSPFTRPPFSSLCLLLEIYPAGDDLFFSLLAPHVEVMERISHFIVHRPKSILLVLVLLTPFFAFHARRIRIDSSVEYLLATHDPNQQYYAEMRALFGSDTIGVIGLVADNVYT